MAKAYIDGKYIDIEQSVPVLTDEEKRMAYETTVASMIRGRYSLNEELALHRQRDTKPTEWNKYYTYCEECKTKAGIY